MSNLTQFDTVLRLHFDRCELGCHFGSGVEGGEGLRKGGSIATWHSFPLLRQFYGGAKHLPSNDIVQAPTSKANASGRYGGLKWHVRSGSIMLDGLMDESFAPTQSGS